LSDLKTKNNFTKTRPLADDFFYADIQKNGQTDINCYRRFRVFFQMLIKHVYSRQIFEKF